jgi:hypothetical protein
MTFRDYLHMMVDADRLLASSAGLHIRQFAEVQGTCDKTVRRLLNAMSAEMGVVLELDESDYTWRYADRKFRLFSEKACRKSRRLRGSG